MVIPLGVVQLYLCAKLAAPQVYISVSSLPSNTKPFMVGLISSGTIEFTVTKTFVRPLTQPFVVV